jgi:hypothetical protein
MRKESERRELLRANETKRKKVCFFFVQNENQCSNPHDDNKANKA